MIYSHIVSQDKYDYGWLRGGQLGSGLTIGSYYGPPHSMWYSIMLIIVVSACGWVVM